MIENEEEITDEYFKKHDPEYYRDFMNLDRDDKGNIIANQKFVDCMKKHLPDAFHPDDFYPNDLRIDKDLK